MIITSAEQLRNLTGSYYANNDFEKIRSTLMAVEYELRTTLGMDTLEGLEGEALQAAQQAVAYMATMRFYRLNDISHETMGRKVKIDKENEARPFEWQLARDDRMHLEEYYRALDRLIDLLQDDADFQETRIWQRQQRLIVKDADSLSYLTGADPSPWLYVRLTPYLDESQRFVLKAYGGPLPEETEENGEILHAARMAVSLGAIALMGRRTSLQTMPYGLMKIFESDGGGNRMEQAAIDRLDDYLKHLSGEQRYWLEEMKHLRDQADGKELPTHLQMPENAPHDKFMRL